MLIPITIGIMAGLQGFNIPIPTPPTTLSLPVSSGFCFGISALNTPDNGVYGYSSSLSAIFPVGQVPMIFPGDSTMPYPFYRINNPVGQTFLTFDRTTTLTLTSFTLQTDFRMAVGNNADGLWINCFNTQFHNNTGFISASAFRGLDGLRGEQGIHGALSIYIPDDYNGNVMRFHYRQTLDSPNVDIGAWAPFDPSEGETHRLITQYIFNGNTLNTNVTAIRNCTTPALSTAFTTSFTTTNSAITAFNPRVGYIGVTGGITGNKDVGNITFSSPQFEFAPASLSGLFLWVDAADFSTLGFLGSSTTTLSAWNDKSGANRNFIQDGVTYTTGNSYPRYLTSAQSRSTRNCIALSSVSQYFDPNALFFVNNRSADFNAVSGTYTLFVVAKNNNTTNGITVISKSGPTTPRRILDLKLGHNTNSVADIGQGPDGSGAAFTITSPISTNAYTYRWNSTASFDGFQNGTKIPGSIIGTPIFGINTNPLSLGLSIGFNSQPGFGINYHAESTFNAELHEILLYNRTLTDAEVTRVNNYLISKWGIIV